MRFWRDNPELYDEIITNALPEPWKTRVIEGEIELSEVPQDIFHDAAINGEREFWADRADYARMMAKENKLRE